MLLNTAIWFFFFSRSTIRFFGDFVQHFPFNSGRGCLQIIRRLGGNQGRLSSQYLVAMIFFSVALFFVPPTALSIILSLPIGHLYKPEYSNIKFPVFFFFNIPGGATNRWYLPAAPTHLFCPAGKSDFYINSIFVCGAPMKSRIILFFHPDPTSLSGLTGGKIHRWINWWMDDRLSDENVSWKVYSL